MKALIISFFNSSNIGDCILSNCLVKLFENNLECDKISYKLQPFEFSDIHNIKPVKPSAKAGAKSKIIKTIDDIGLYRLVEEYYWRKRYLSKNDETKVLNLIKKTDIVIIGGGNMIFDLENGSLSAGRFRYFSKLCKKMNKPIFTCCIGFGPFNNDNQIKKAMVALGASTTISFRDKKSFQIYSDAGGKKGCVSTDPAFLLDKEKKTSHNRYIALNIIDPAVFTQDKTKINAIESKYRSLIRELMGKYTIKVFTTDIRDYSFAKKISDSYSVSTININSIDLLIDLYKNAHLIIGSRMHSMIIALTQEKPIIGLKWQNKVSELFNYMELEEYCHNIDNYNIYNIEQQVNKLLVNDYSATKKHIKKKVQAQKKKLKNNIEIAKTIIHDANEARQ